MRIIRDEKNHYKICERKVTGKNTKYILRSSGGLVRLVDTKHL